MPLELELNVIKYCAEECYRQNSGEKSVYDMVNAWNWAQEQSGICLACPSSEIHEKEIPKVTLDFIEHLGKLVEPHKNLEGFRTIPIGVSNGITWIEKADWREVPRLLNLLLSSYYEDILWDSEMKKYALASNVEDVFYYEYENIHPFRDGNGRTGKILYNYLRGTLNDPIMPPNFWNISNP